MGARPTRPPLQPEATGAVMEVTKWLKPSVYFGIACHELVSLDFRCGSIRDQDGPSGPRRLSGVEPKKSARKQTLRLEGLRSAPDSARRMRCAAAVGERHTRKAQATSYSRADEPEHPAPRPDWRPLTEARGVLRDGREALSRAPLCRVVRAQHPPELGRACRSRRWC